MAHESSPEDPSSETPNASTTPETTRHEALPSTLSSWESDSPTPTPDNAPTSLSSPDSTLSAPQSSPTPPIVVGDATSLDTTAIAPVVLAAAPTAPPSESPPVRLGPGVASESTDVDYENQTTRVAPDAVTTTNQRLHVSRDAVVVSQDELDALNTPRPQSPPSLAVASPPPVPYGSTDTSLVDLGEAIAEERDDEQSRPAWWNIALVLLPILLALGGYGLWHTLSSDDASTDRDNQNIATDESTSDATESETSDATESESEISVGVDTDDGSPSGTGGLDDSATPTESESEVSIGVDVDDGEPSDDDGLEGSPTPIESESEVSIGVDVDDREPSDDDGLEDSPTPSESESEVSIGVDVDDGEPNDDDGSGRDDDEDQGGFDFSESGGTSTGGQADTDNDSSGSNGSGDNDSSGSIGGFSESDADSSTGADDTNTSGGSGGGSGGGDNGGGSGGGDGGGSGNGSGGGTGILRTASIDFQSEYAAIAPTTTDDAYTFAAYDVADTDISFFLPDEYPERDENVGSGEVSIDTYSSDELDWYSSGIYIGVYGSATVVDRIEEDAEGISDTDGCGATETSELPLNDANYPDQFFADPITVGDWDGYYAYYASCSTGDDLIDFVNIVFETDDGLVDIIARVENEQDLVAIDRLLQSIVV